MRTILVGLLAGTVTFLSVGEAASLALPKVAPVKLEPIADLEGPAGSKEVYGIIASRQWPGNYWVHNDSGDETIIYTVDLYGRLK